MKSGAGHGEKKTRKAEQFIAALLMQPSIDKAARSVGISSATAWRWMQDASFMREYRAARREAMRQTTTRLQNAASEAVDCLREVQANGESESARVAAARTILDCALKALDLEDIQQRIEAIEAKLEQQRKDTAA